MVVQNAETLQQQNEMANVKQCPFSAHVNFASLPTDERSQIKNFITNKTLSDTLHEKARKQVCPADFCNGSLMGIPNPHENRTSKQTLLEAVDFLNQYFSFNKRANTPEHQARVESVKEELKRTGTINYNFDELSFGAKTAWRNASRCIGRIQWNKLFLNDARDIKSTKDMFDAVCKHIVYATNGGNLRSTITLFPQRVPFREDWRLWNGQLISFAGYPLEDGSVLGDPINVEFTQVCLKLGWKKPADTRTQFDVLPLIFSGPGEQPTVYELPEEIILRVDIHHPTSTFLDDLNLQWYALPAVSGMLFDVGGIVFPAAPFNGWYMGTEIAARDFLDASRYNLGRKLARRLDLNTLNTSNLWLDRVALELNVAVLHSFQKKNVTIVDHHTASESFIKHLETETKLRGGCPGDWVWITPPMSSSLTKVFHQEMINYHLKPSYEYQKPAHKVYDWKREPVNLKYHLKSVAQAVLFNNLLHKITLKKRPTVTILFATETGVSEHYASKLAKMLKNTFNCRVICMENYDVDELPNERIVLFVSSTFGNGESPDNGTKFWKYVHSLQPSQIDLSKLQYAVFALGSSQYSTFCEFGKNLDRCFRKLGAHPLAGVGLADELKGQSTMFGKWAKVLYEHTCKKFNIEMTSNNLEVEEEVYNPHKVRLIELDDHRPEIGENLSKMHNKQIVQLDTFSVEQLLPVESDKQVLLVKLKPPTDDYQLDYKPGDHLAVFPKNPSDLVDRVLSHLKPDTVGMYSQDIQKTTYRIEVQSNGKWLHYSKLPECTLREALTSYLDITGPPSLKFLKSILPFAEDELDKQRMQKLITNHRDYEEWKQWNCPTLADLFDHFPSLKLGPKILFTQLNLLQPRYYSISSSLASSPNEVHLTMTVVTMDKKGSSRKGLCTSWFAEKPTELVNCFLRKAPAFHMPEDINKPIIMVSAGSGIAPFRSFWMQGCVDQQESGKCHKMFLFFGCRRTRLDNIYGFEFPELLTKGVILDIFYAYSRDSQHKKRYVQDQVYKQKALIYYLLEKEDAHIYVCGGAKMASGVKQAVKRLFLEEERLTEQEADNKLQQLFDANRYHEDVFGAVH